MTSLSEARADLKGIAGTLRRLERGGLGLADAAQGLGRVSNVLGVALEELGRLQCEQMALGNDFGDHLLGHERDYPSPAELREYLAFMREDRKKGAEV